MEFSLLNTIRIEEMVKTSCVNSTQYRDILYEKFQKRIIYNPALDRTLVSFQANKHSPFYSWFKYKEGFSQRLVAYLLNHLWPDPPGVLLDPFAGSGVALFAAKTLGWDTNGIEVLPVGIYAIKARLASSQMDINLFEKNIDHLKMVDFLSYYDENYAFEHIPITKGAFLPEAEKQLIGYISYCHNQVKNQDVRTVLLYAAFCILEEISYTRKDGQYLRWDYRSGRSNGKKPFNKGYIKKFSEALAEKLYSMLTDIKGELKQGELFLDHDSIIQTGSYPNLYEGSCLELLPTIPADSIDFILTSPPYANRYDYTRTYALELVYLGCKEEDVKRLRQTMLSCTVENKDKKMQLQENYSLMGHSVEFDLINRTFEQQAALHEVLSILEDYRDKQQLNNKQIVRMLRNYFYEMCFVIFELSRITRQGSIIAMVNDNVQYAGEQVPVDLILSNIAETFGLTTRYIWTLGRGKGNSSQQMGNHRRSELRKCVYVWEKVNSEDHFYLTNNTNTSACGEINV